MMQSADITSAGMSDLDLQSVTVASTVLATLENEKHTKVSVQEWFKPIISSNLIDINEKNVLQLKLNWIFKHNNISSL